MLADRRHLRICTDEWHPTASPHSVFPTKSARVKLQLYIQNKTQLSEISWRVVAVLDAKLIMLWC